MVISKMYDLISGKFVLILVLVEIGLGEGPRD